LALLSGCAVPPTERPLPGTTASERAEQALALGDQRGAAFALVDVATQQAPAEARLTLLEAAWLYARSGNEPDALLLLERVAIDDASTPVLRQRQLAVLAELMVQSGEADKAIDLIDTLYAQTEESIEPEAAAMLLASRADAHRLLGQLFQSARDLAEALLLDQRPGVFEQRRDQLWAVLEHRPRLEIDAWPFERGAALGAWLELALLINAQRFDPLGLPSALDAWAQRQPDVIARGGWLVTLTDRQMRRRDHPARIAALLPLSGERELAGRAVRDGLLSAWYALPQPRPELRFHDIGSDASQVSNTLQLAIDQGAEFIIGPLTRDQVAVIAEQSEVGTPILALNASPGDRPPPRLLYQFGLLPEHEADSAARHARAKGLFQVATLAPEGAWGRRLTSAFRAGLEHASADELGRVGTTRVVAEARYDEQSQDHGSTLRRLFLLPDSETRRRRLQTHLNAPILHEPRRRQDIDAIFLAAIPEQGRLLQPQIRFHQGGDLTLLATSQVFDGNLASRDPDLRDVIFFARPSLLVPPEANIGRSRFTELLGEDSDGPATDSLYYLGVDALRLLPRLPDLRLHGTREFSGASGVLSVAPDGAVGRVLPAARFSATGVVAAD